MKLNQRITYIHTYIFYAPNRLSAGALPPDTTGGAYSAPHIRGLRGPTSKGTGGGMGRTGGKRWVEREEGGSSSFAVGRKRKLGASDFM